VRTAVTAGRARPSGPKLSVLLRRSYALTSAMCCCMAGVVAAPVEAPVHHPLDAGGGPAGTPPPPPGSPWPPPSKSWPRSWPSRRVKGSLSWAWRIRP
jgi:hypothetical protein